MLSIRKPYKVCSPSPSDDEMVVVIVSIVTVVARVGVCLFGFEVGGY